MGLVFSFFLLNSCQSEQKSYSLLQGSIFHTTYHIKYDLKEDYRPEVNKTFEDFSLSLNPFEAKSLLTAINKNETRLVDSAFLEVWAMAKRIAQATEGRYDPTASPLINAWGFGFKKGEEHLTQAKIDSLLTFVGYDKIKLKSDTLLKADERMVFDLSSISKGYCSDLVGKCLQAKGAKNYLVELGGEIAFKGHNERGLPWQIGINKPIEDSTGQINELELIIRLDRASGGLATSGNYRNYKIKDGKKYAHTIDPRTGYPTQTDVLSATILAPTCMQADGLATACMTMSSKDVPQMLSAFPEVEYLLILADEKGGFRSIMSEGLERLVVRPD